MKKIICMALAAILVLSLSVGASAAKLSGNVSTNGSTSMEKVIGILSEQFMEDNSDVTITYDATGSGTGIEAVSNGTCDIGLSSRALKDVETEKGLVATTVALDGIAIIVNADCPVDDLTVEQIADIFTGKITSWEDFGGKGDIACIGREAGSGTRGAFEELLKIEDQCAYAQELDSTGGVLAKVAATPGSIGYVSLDVVDDTVTALSLNGVAPSEENIVAGSYTLSRPFVMATKGAIDAQSDAVKTWFSYVESDAGKAVITGLGLILPQ